jgi:hypothetical protein
VQVFFRERAFSEGCIEETKRKDSPVEEQIIQEFVHRVSTDENLRQELATTPDSVIMREGFSPRVARVVARLVPHMTVEQSIGSAYQFWN